MVIKDILRVLLGSQIFAHLRDVLPDFGQVEGSEVLVEGLIDQVLVDVEEEGVGNVARRFLVSKEVELV